MSEPTRQRTARHDGTVAIVTGASRGIGLGIARRLVAEGAQGRASPAARPRRSSEAVARARRPRGRARRRRATPTTRPTRTRSIARGPRRPSAGCDLPRQQHRHQPGRTARCSTPRLDAARKILEVNVARRLLAGSRRPSPAGSAPRSTRGRSSTSPRSPGCGATGVHRLVRREQGRADPPHHRARPPSSARRSGSTPSPRPSSRPSSPRRSTRGARRRWPRAYPMKRLGVPEDVAGAVVVPAVAPTPRWITGQTLVVDGGVTLGGAL